MSIKSSWIILAVSVSSLITTACTTGGPLEARHRPTGVHKEIADLISQTPPPQFSEYLATAKRALGKGRSQHDGATAKNIIAETKAVLPFEGKPAEKCAGSRHTAGALLIHGLTDSSFVMRNVAQVLQSYPSCLLVRAIVLPGHGTVPGDLLATRYQEWTKAVEYGINSFEGTVQDLYIIGFSTGGALAVYETLTREQLKIQPTALVLLSPAIKVKNRFAFAADWHKLISWAYPRAAWSAIAIDEDFAKYESFPKNAGYEVFLLTKAVGKLLQNKKINVPMLIAVSKDDATIDADAAISFFRRNTTVGDQSRLILYTKEEQTQDQDSRIQRRRGLGARRAIRDISHLAIPISPTNLHYGEDGDYVNCLHYLNKNEKMQTCKNRSLRSVEYGESSDSNNGVLRRLTWNPDFEHLRDEIGRFVAMTQYCSLKLVRPEPVEG